MSKKITADVPDTFVLQRRLGLLVSILGLISLVHFWATVLVVVFRGIEAISITVASLFIVTVLALAMAIRAEMRLDKLTFVRN